MQSRTGQDYHNGHSMSDIPKEIKKKYDIIKVIGEGNFAVVYECVDKYVLYKYILINPLSIWHKRYKFSLFIIIFETKDSY